MAVGNKGGARPNAGRKPSKNKQVNETIRISVELRAALDKYVLENALESRAVAIRYILKEKV